MSSLLRFLALAAALTACTDDAAPGDAVASGGKADGAGGAPLYACRNSLVNAGHTWRYETSAFNGDASSLQLTVSRDAQVYPVVTLDRIPGSPFASPSFWAKDATGKTRVALHFYESPAAITVAHLSLGDGDNVAYPENSTCRVVGSEPSCRSGERLACDASGCHCAAPPVSACKPSDKLASGLAPHIENGEVSLVLGTDGTQMCLGPYPIYDLSKLSLFDADLIGAGAALGADCTVRSDGAGHRTWDPQYCIWTPARTAFGDPGAIAVSFTAETPAALFQTVASVSSLVDAIANQAPSAADKSLFGSYVTQMGTFLLQQGAQDLVSKVSFENGLTVALIWDRFGQFYWSVAPSIGVSGVAGIGVTAIYPNQPFDTPAQARSFLTGSGWSACGNVGMVGCVLHSGSADRLDKGNWGISVGVGWPPGVSYSWGMTQRYDFCPALGKVWSDAQAGCL